MINFRYHVVSLTAVFLALAIGLVVGTAALNGPLSDQLSDRVNALGRQNQQYRDQVTHLEEEANKQEQFATEAAPIMLADKLAGKRVLVVSMASASKYVEGVLQNLQLSGAKVTGRVEIQDRFTDPLNKEELGDLATITRPATVTGLPANVNGVETATGLLAAVLLDRAANLPAVPEDSRRTLLAAFASRGYLIVTGEVTGPAQAVVLVAGPPYVDREAPKKNAAAVTIASGLDQAAPLVVAGSGVGGDGNLLAQLRGDPALTKTVSTVDNVSSAQGRVVTVLALVEQLEGHTGHYGIGAGATLLMPKPAGERSRSGT